MNTKGNTAELNNLSILQLCGSRKSFRYQSRVAESKETLHFCQVVLIN